MLTLELMSGLTIKTTTDDWLRLLAAAYTSQTPVTLVDDAGLGVDPVHQTLLEMGKKAHLTVSDWMAVVVALGVSSVGAFLVVMAVLDPEPYSKIGFALGAGAVMTMGGGFAAIRVLTKQKPPRVRLSPAGFEIAWD